MLEELYSPLEPHRSEHCEKATLILSADSVEDPSYPKMVEQFC